MRDRWNKASKLAKEGFFCVDMHSHSTYSDGGATVEQLLKKASTGDFCFALTDHNTIQGVMRARQISNGSTMIPGMEVSSSEGVHLLVYAGRLSEMSSFYADAVHRQRRPDPFSRTNRSLMELAEEAQKVNALTSIAHPFGPLWTNLKKYMASGKKVPPAIPAVEVLNGEQLPLANKEAREFAGKYALAFTAGSDAHTLKEFGGVLACAQSSSAGEFLEQVRHGRVEVRGREIPLTQRLRPHTNALRTHVRFASSFLSYKWQAKIRPTINKKLKIGKSH